jgi:hypothetical protein
VWVPRSGLPVRPVCAGCRPGSSCVGAPARAACAGCRPGSSCVGCPTVRAMNRDEIPSDPGPLPATLLRALGRRRGAGRAFRSAPRRKSRSCKCRPASGHELSAGPGAVHTRDPPAASRGALHHARRAQLPREVQAFLHEPFRCFERRFRTNGWALLRGELQQVAANRRVCTRIPAAGPPYAATPLLAVVSQRVRRGEKSPPRP